ncbi:MAG: hypothetical protein K8T90_14420 [Planctomycetes bacterium]|nr:hypothetical protein [Planctomycetota bacterium]
MSLNATTPRAIARLLAVVAVLLAVVGGATAPDALAARKATLPGWSLIGDYDLQVDPGFVSVAGNYDFSIEGASGSLQVVYKVGAGKRAALAAGGLFNFTFLTLTGTFSVDEVAEGNGPQRIALTDTVKNPNFAFDGVVQPDGRTIVGTYLRRDGFAALPGTVTGELTLRRVTPLNPPTAFRLIFASTMVRSGVVSGGLDGDRKEKRAFLEVYRDGSGNQTFDGGKVTGRVVTKAATATAPATTTAKVKIVGKGWTAALDGPIDADGFHAAVDLRAAGFQVVDAPMLLPVQAGPEPPPPPPPPPPANLLDKGVAKVVAGHVTVTRGSVPKKFFGAAGSITVELPTTAFGQTVVADPSTASVANPTRFFVKIGTKTYGTGATGGAVSMKVRSFVRGSAQVIEVLCTGTVADGTGGVKQLFPPDGILLQATVAR